MTQSARFWDKIAEKYARTPVSDEATYQKKLAETRAFFTPEMRILEFGCGTGSTAITHAPHVAHIDAIDISENMIAIGREKAQKAGVDNITFHQGTLEEFHAESESLDMVLGLNVLHLLPNRQTTLTEAARILKPGGRFVTSTACLGSSYLRFIKLVEPLGKLFGMMPDVYVMKEQELADELREAGFEIESQWRHGAQGVAVFMIGRKVGG